MADGTQYVLNLLIGTYAVILTGIAAILWTRLNRVEDGHTNLRLQIASSYHTKDELRQVIDDAMRALMNEVRRLNRGVEDLRALVLHGANPGGRHGESEA